MTVSLAPIKTLFPITRCRAPFPFLLYVTAGRLLRGAVFLPSLLVAQAKNIKSENSLHVRSGEKGVRSKEEEEKGANF